MVYQALNNVILYNAKLNSPFAYTSLEINVYSKRSNWLSELSYLEDLNGVFRISKHKKKKRVIFLIESENKFGNILIYSFQLPNLQGYRLFPIHLDGMENVI